MNEESPLKPASAEDSVSPDSQDLSGPASSAELDTSMPGASAPKAPEETPMTSEKLEVAASVTPGMAPEEHPRSDNDRAPTSPTRLEPISGDQEDLDSEKITFAFKRSHFYSALVPLAFVLGLSVGYLFWGRSELAPRTEAAAPAQSQSTNAEGASSGQSQPAAGDAPQRYDIPVDDDPALGPEDAPITIVEFSDYECQYCQRFHVETFSRLLEAYPGQIRFVYRDFPLTQIHPNAVPAAEAANCARDQGAFWEYHDLLFVGSEGLNRSAYLSYATQLGLEQEAFTACLDARTYQAEVQADFDFAARLGVRSTPTFFINGLPLIGAQPFEVFKQVLDRELAGEIP